MVKRSWPILAFAALLILALALAGGWLLYTPAGALWTLGRIDASTELNLSVTSLDGNLLSGLELEGLELGWEGGEIRADRFEYEWQPRALLQGKLQIDFLEAGVVRLQLATRPGEEDLRPFSPAVPELTPLFAALGGWKLALARLQISTLELQREERPLLRLSRLEGRLYADGDEVRLDEGGMDGDWGRWRGSLGLTGSGSQLAGRLNWIPPVPLGSLESFAAELSLQRDGSGGLAGPLALQGASEEGASYSLSGDLRLDLAGLTLGRLLFARSSTLGGQVSGELALAWQPQFSWVVNLALTDLDLAPELKRATRLSGLIAITGTTDAYRGRVDLHNTSEGWERVSLAADLEGGTGRLNLTQLRGVLLAGEVEGVVELGWDDRFRSSYRLFGAGLQLVQLPSGVEGEVDLQLDGWLEQDVQSGWRVGGQASIPRGELLGREFSAELQADWLGGRDLQISRFELRGGWGALQMDGMLDQRLNLQLQLQDAALLWPPLRGVGELSGWLAWSGDLPHGELSGQFGGGSFREWTIDGVKLVGVRETVSTSASLELNLSGLQRGAAGVESLHLALQGEAEAHRLQLQLSEGLGQTLLELEGGLQGDGWRGSLFRLDLQAEGSESFHLQEPVALHYGPARMGFSELLLAGDQGGRLRIVGERARQDGTARIVAAWRKFNLRWLSGFLATVDCAGESSGRISFVRNAAREIRLDLLSDYVGTLGYAGQELRLTKAQIFGRWDGEGFSLGSELYEEQGGGLKFSAKSVAAGGLSVGRAGRFELELVKFPLALLNAQLPPGSELEGRLAADVNGGWGEGGLFTIFATAEVEEGMFRYQAEGERLELPLSTLNLKMDWQEDQLKSEAYLGLGTDAGLSGNLLLQLPARWPFDPERQIPLGGELQFQLDQLGLLSVMAPELLADLAGEIEGSLKLSGSLQQPDFSGELQLVNGRLNAPQLGVQFEQAEVGAVFGAQSLRIERIAFRSGDGEFAGEGEVRFVGWKPQELVAQLRGESVLIVDLPELRVLASPSLELTGNAAGLSLTGQLKIPELLLLDWHPPERVSRSEDLIYVDRLPQPEKRPPFKIKLDLGVELGERVIVKQGGLDVRLRGRIQLQKGYRQELLARGEIDIPEGHFSAYGVKLPLTSGRIFFSGGPADNPSLDIIAAKKISDVTAGVAVGGTARQPEIRLFSDPFLDDTDILSYIVLGRPTTGGSGDFSALSLAAGALLSVGDSASFQQQLSVRSGIDVVDVETGEAGDLESSMVTVGKYLTPELYLSYGRALSGSSNQIQLRYSPNERVDVESQLGDVSGADLYYRIEFNDFSYQ